MLYLASDHAGFALKEKIKTFLTAKKIKFEDIGTHSTESVDYPVFGQKLGQKVAENPKNKGIAICGTGMGICMAVNKVPRVRAAMVYSLETAKLCREHNDANVICVGSRTQSEKDVLVWLQAFLDTPSADTERHNRRIKQLNEAIL